MDNINNDEYEFYVNGTRNFETYPIKEGVTKMMKTGDLYLGFSFQLLQRNTNIRTDVSNFLDDTGLSDKWNIDRCVPHCFVYSGTQYSSGAHAAPISDIFVQVSNTKRWRFVPPRYNPYMRPVGGINKAGQTQSGYDYIPDDVKFQYIDVESRPGDLMYFPPFWWHDV